MNLQYNTLFLAIKIMLPIIPTSNATGHINTARMKNTGSSPMPVLSQNPSPSNLIKIPKTRLCKMTLSPIPAAAEPVRIKNAFEILVNLAIAASTISAIPRKDQITLIARLIK